MDKWCEVVLCLLFLLSFSRDQTIIQLPSLFSLSSRSPFNEAAVNVRASCLSRTTNCKLLALAYALFNFQTQICVRIFFGMNSVCSPDQNQRSFFWSEIIMVTEVATNSRPVTKKSIFTTG